ncbi:uncharacterized protein I303_105165 [Kwoniella dejecticola CBS 10117]|uniref:Uncharacterized protein n=1 Tax=Kwoniella dejecticola CBS 10117 TaxID=1296121 RepID=A0A1A6A3A0_9TREE|nr:uncharacterized protein I303_05389 [Kwoniella dejecticola CBS 10117]OBR84530.1 hypothetical protein I303_05389 [Kwoniella dejecticola CBS 10117]
MIGVDTEAVLDKLVDDTALLRVHDETSATSTTSPTGNSSTSTNVKQPANNTVLLRAQKGTPTNPLIRKNAFNPAPKVYEAPPNGNGKRQKTVYHLLKSDQTRSGYRDGSEAKAKRIRIGSSDSEGRYSAEDDDSEERRIAKRRIAKRRIAKRRIAKTKKKIAKKTKIARMERMARLRRASKERDMA